jgi:signal transduction histidine kinase
MKAQRPAQLAWIVQAALIVLPVAILSGVALHFLHEDKTAIEKEARDRANSLAPEVARRISEQSATLLADGRNKGAFTQGQIVDGKGMADPDYLSVPAPADWPGKLPPPQLELWQTAQKATFQDHNGDAANKALTALTESSLSGPVRANAQLALLIAAEPHGDAPALIRQAVSIAHQYPGVVTESGAPVADLALLVALRHIKDGNPPQTLLTAIENNLTRNPSFLSTNMLDALAVAATVDPGKGTAAWLRDSWHVQENNRQNARNLMQMFVPRLRLRNTPTLLYVDDYPNGAKPAPTALSPHPGMALCIPQDDGWRITLTELEPLRRALRPAFYPILPPYMGAWLNVEGERWVLDDRLNPNFVPLAYGKGNLTLDAKYPFTLTIGLTNPDVLYAPYRRRLPLIQWLIFSAAAAALFGLWRLWHTYRQQTRLGEMKSNLVSSVSHELRAPIAAVRLMAESLESGRVEGAEKQKDYYRLIVRECRRLSSLIENVLDFSRIDQGRKQYHLEPLDALALLRHTVMLLEPGAAERHVRLRLIDPPPDFANLQPSWDSEAVEQSLVNLLDNAIKHSPADAEVRVEIEVLPAAVRFWVTDRGPGIPADEHQKIFDLFYRYGSELRRETEGVGIGLSIVKHVAEAHGGRVLVESTVGQGSRFGLELPK